MSSHHHHNPFVNHEGVSCSFPKETSVDDEEDQMVFDFNHFHHQDDDEEEEEGDVVDFVGGVFAHDQEDVIETRRRHKTSPSSSSSTQRHFMRDSIHSTTSNTTSSDSSSLNLQHSSQFGQLLMRESNVDDDEDEEDYKASHDQVLKASSSSTEEENVNCSLLDMISRLLWSSSSSSKKKSILMEDLLTSYPFLIQKQQKTSLCCRRCITRTFVDYILLKSSTKVDEEDDQNVFDSLLSLTLLWINCFFNDFDHNFQETKRILIHLKTLTLKNTNHHLHSSPSKTDQQTTTTIESGLDLISLTLSLKSRVRRLSLDSNFKIIVLDDEHYLESSNKQHESSEVKVIAVSCSPQESSSSSCFISKDLYDRLQETCPSCSSLVRHQLILREGDRLLKPISLKEPAKEIVVKFDPFSYQTFLRNKRRNHHRHLSSTSIAPPSKKSSSKQSSCSAILVYNSKTGQEYYLLVTEETSAREVVMILARDLFLSNSAFDSPSSMNSTTSSLKTQIKRKLSKQIPSSTSVFSSSDFALYQVSVSGSSIDSVTVRSRRIADSSNNLWTTLYNNNNSSFSRFLLKTISSSEESDFEKKLRESLVDSFVNRIKSSSSTEVVSLTELDPIVLSIEFSFHAYSLFCCLDPQTIVSSVLSSDPTKVTNNKQDKELSSFSEKILFFWESLTEAEMFWAINEILAPNSVEDRMKVVKILIRVALYCLFSLRNFSTAASITCALGHSSVSRLRKSLWIPLEKKHKNLIKDLEKLNKVLDPSKNMSFYRRMLSEASSSGLQVIDSSQVTGPLTPSTIVNNQNLEKNPAKKRRRRRRVVIPFYPVHKKDFTFLHLTSETFVKQPEEEEELMVNWSKVRSLVSAVKDFVSLASEENNQDEEEEDKQSKESEDNNIDEDNSCCWLQQFILLNQEKSEENNSTEKIDTLTRDPNRYPFNEIDGDKYRLPTQEGVSDSVFAKKLYNFLSRERMTRSFLRIRFLERNNILFNEDLLMKRSLDIEPVVTSNVVSTGNTSCNLNNTPSTTSSASLAPPPSGPSLESLNSNFHGLLLSSSNNTSTPFGVTSFDQLNKLLSLETKKKSSKSSSLSSVDSRRSSGRSLSTDQSMNNESTAATTTRLAPNALYPSSASSTLVPTISSSSVMTHHPPDHLHPHHLKNHHHSHSHHHRHHHHHHHNHHHQFHHQNSLGTLTKPNNNNSHLLQQQHARLNRESSSLGPALLYPPSVSFARNRPTSPLAAFRKKTVVAPPPGSSLNSLPSYEETIAKLRSLRPASSTEGAAATRSRSTSCPRITNHNQVVVESRSSSKLRENLV